MLILDSVDGGAGSDGVVILHSDGAVPAAEALHGLSRSEKGDKSTAVLNMVDLSCNIPKIRDSHLSQMTKWTKRMELLVDLPIKAFVYVFSNPFVSRKIAMLI